MKFDLKSLLNFEPSILPQAATGNVNGSAVDTKGAQSCAVVGFLDDAATGSFKVQDSDDGSTGWADVADAKIISADDTNDTAGVASDLVSLGVIGAKRYLRVVFTHTGSGDIAAFIALGNNGISPTGTNS